MADYGQEDRLLEALVAYLRAREGLDFAVLSNPDREHPPGQQKQRACDALLGPVGGTAQLAVDVTSTDPYHHRRRDNAHFINGLAPLDQDPDLVALTSCPTSLAVKVHSIPKGVRPADVTPVLKAQLLKFLPTITPGRPATIMLAPWDIIVSVGCRANGPPSFRVARWVPDDLEDQRYQVLSDLLADKVDQLKQYRDRGLRTLLLVESNDMATTNSGLVIAAFERAIVEVPGEQALTDVLLVEAEANPWILSEMRWSAPGGRSDRLSMYDTELKAIVPPDAD